MSRNRPPAMPINVNYLKTLSEYTLSKKESFNLEALSSPTTIISARRSESWQRLCIRGNRYVGFSSSTSGASLCVRNNHVRFGLLCASFTCRIKRHSCVGRQHGFERRQLQCLLRHRQRQLFRIHFGRIGDDGHGEQSARWNDVLFRGDGRQLIRRREPRLQRNLLYYAWKRRESTTDARCDREPRDQ